MSTQLSPREKVLATVVGCIAFIFLNVFILDYFFKNQSRLQRELSTRTQAIAAMKRQLSERPLWDERDAWLEAHQPKVSNEDTAGPQLLDTVQEAARAHQVAIENPGLQVPTAHAEYRAIAVNVETKSTWRGLIQFLHALPGPERFIVFETADLQIDGTDQTQMRGKFRIGRWGAPPGR